MGPLRWRIVGLGAAIVALLAGGTWAALVGTQGSKNGQAHQVPAKPVTVESVSPAPRATGVNGANPIIVQFSAPLAKDSPLPTLSPAIAGSWQRVASTALEFAPSQGIPEDTSVQVSVPSGSAGVRTAAGGLLAAPVVDRFTTGSYSTLRLQQLLAQLGYLPMAWTPLPGDPPSPGDGSSQIGAAYNPPQGTFAWQPGYPSSLPGLWQAGQSNEIDTGAVMAFESDHGMTMNGVAGPQVWQALLTAVAKSENNSSGYTYAVASQSVPETLTIWHNGREVESSPANTGISDSPTADGTFPVYLKYTFQIMSGTNPDGSSYADPVSWVSYFNGGDAVHYFPRGSYGFPQSLGCVELPFAQAKQAYPYLTYGSLVTVTG